MKLSTAAHLASIGPASAFYAQAPITVISEGKRTSLNKVSPYFADELERDVSFDEPSKADKGYFEKVASSASKAFENSLSNIQKTFDSNKSRNSATTQDGMPRANQQRQEAAFTEMRDPRMRESREREQRQNSFYTPSRNQGVRDQGLNSIFTEMRGPGARETGQNNAFKPDRSPRPKPQNRNNFMTQTRTPQTKPQRQDSSFNRPRDPQANKLGLGTFFKPRKQDRFPLTRDQAQKFPLAKRDQAQSSAITEVSPKNNQINDIWESSPQIPVQGGSLRTWSYPSPAVERVQVILKTQGRPLDSVVELWQGPENTPVKMRVYVEDGNLRPFSAVIETPRGPNTVSIRNVGQIEFPLAACVTSKNVQPISNEILMQGSSAIRIQGGALKTYPFQPNVESVAVLLNSDGRPMNARIELLQGPNNNKQVIELYTDDGLQRPFHAVISTPGAGNVIRIKNTSPIEFPFTARVEANEISSAFAPLEAVLGGDTGPMSKFFPW